jgi:membrane protease YdiL (CAAX protease family)
MRKAFVSAGRYSGAGDAPWWRRCSSAASFRRAIEKFTFLGAALMSGFLFSLAHGQPTTLIPFTLVGMTFAAGYAYTGSLWTTIASHFTFNLISFTVALATH